MKDLRTLLAEIDKITDTCKKQMFTAGVVCEAFSRKGFNGIIVGGSAIEFYTEGQYMSGDVDICWAGDSAVPTHREKAGVMAELGGTGGVRSFVLNGLYFDLLNQVETVAQTDFITLESPYGNLRLMPIEELIVERTFYSVYPQANKENEDCARKLIAYGLSETGPCDWAEVRRIAAGKEYQISEELESLVQEVRNGIEI